MAIRDALPESIRFELVGLEEHLLRNPASEYPQVRTAVAAGKVVSSANFQVRFLHQRRPKQAWIIPIDHVNHAICAARRQSVVDYDSPKTAVEVQSSDVLAILRHQGSSALLIIRMQHSPQNLLVPAFRPRNASTQRSDNRTISRSILHQVDLPGEGHARS